MESRTGSTQENGAEEIVMRILRNANLSFALYVAILMWCFLAIEMEVFNDSV